MKVSDYIVEFLIAKQIGHVFGYPGGMVIHLMDSFSKYADQIHAHICYHEQAAAFEACAYAQCANVPGVAYATSGPGATNLITGICNAYFDSIPVIFITGQVNTFESGQGYGVRQRGFQETDIVKIVAPVTKYAVRVEQAEDIRACLEKAYYLAVSGRKGPVLLDIPMDVQRADVAPDTLKGWQPAQKERNTADYAAIKRMLDAAERPVLLLGAGVKHIPNRELVRFVEHMRLPVLTSMIAVDVLPHPLNFGFLGAYGKRCANFIAAKSDLVFVLGSRLDVRQVGGNRREFAPDAQIIRVDIDPGELEYRIRESDVNVTADAADVVRAFLRMPQGKENTHWLQVCNTIRRHLENIDKSRSNDFMAQISKFVPENTIITTDVGQNQVWAAQSFQIKQGQKMLFSGGHGAMGYSLPAAIGAYYSTRGGG